MTTENPSVQSQYSKWIYPQPVEDLDENHKQGGRQIADPATYYHLLWPSHAYRPLNILVAGCGTNQAAVLAYTNPDHHITGIDISQTSIDHTRYLQNKHNLSNLDIHHLSLLDVQDLGQQFDLIYSTGVLHHLPEPVHGARALKSVLRPDGVMHLMLYGKTKRAGVYLLQEAFRAMGLKQTQEDVDLVKAMLPHLPEKHAMHMYGINGKDFQYDAGIVDTLLHPQDTAYSVSDIYDFAEQSGLTFRGWLDNGVYCPENYFKPDFPGMERLKQMSDKERAHFVDNFLQRTGTHRFNLCHPEVDPATYTISFAGDEWLDFVPITRKPLQVVRQPNWAANQPPVLRRGPYTFRLAKAGSLLLESVDGERTIAQCAERAFANVANMQQDPQQVARTFFQNMWNKGHIFFKKPSVK